jgi:hypothetical protein
MIMKDGWICKWNCNEGEQSPFDLVVIKAVRSEDGKLRLLYFKPYGL